MRCTRTRSTPGRSSCSTTPPGCSMPRSGSRRRNAPPGRRRTSTPRSASSPWNGIFYPGGPDDEHSGSPSGARPHPPGSVGAPAMRPAEPGPLRGVPARCGHGRDGPGADAPGRREDALARVARPDIFNTDQGSQSTSSSFTGKLLAAGIRISMDGRGRWLDNVFIERLWRSLKYEDVYLKGYADGREARAGIAAWIAFYNTRRPHQALGGQAPLAVWRAGTSGALGAKAVDLTLRLDNAGALPTGPQLNEQQQAPRGLILEEVGDGSESNYEPPPPWSHTWGPLQSPRRLRRCGNRPR